MPVWGIYDMTCKRPFDAMYLTKALALEEIDGIGEDDLCPVSIYGIPQEDAAEPPGDPYPEEKCTS